MATKKQKRQPKTTRSREYTGPNTLEEVKKYLETNALQKAKVKAIEALPKEEQVELFEWIRKRMLHALNVYQNKIDALAKERGFKIPDR